MLTFFKWTQVLTLPTILNTNRGVKALSGLVPHKEAAAMRKEIIARFGKTHHQRMQRKAYGIGPDEQECLRRLFRKHHAEEKPAFECHTDECQRL